MKMVAVSISEKCIKEPRCKFCYAKNEPKYEKWDLMTKLEQYSKMYPEATFCFEYNGWNLEFLIYLNRYDKIPNRKTITTMPISVNDNLIVMFKSLNISAISLSYDSEKVKNDKEWLKVAKIIKKNKIKLACNYLIENFPFKISNEIVKLSDQINLLVKKPTGRLNEKQLNYVKSYINYLKNYKPLTTDNCLGFQLGLVKECLAGKEFIHINPDGSETGCCFKEKCFLYR